MRPGPHQIGTAGASDGDALLYDAAIDEYAPGPVSTGGGGGAVPAREVLMATGVAFPAEPLEATTGGDWLYGEAP